MRLKTVRSKAQNSQKPVPGMFPEREFVMFDCVGTYIADRKTVSEVI